MVYGVVYMMLIWLRCLYRPTGAYRLVHRLVYMYAAGVSMGGLCGYSVL